MGVTYYYFEYHFPRKQDAIFFSWQDILCQLGTLFYLNNLILMSASGLLAACLILLAEGLLIFSQCHFQVMVKLRSPRGNRRPMESGTPPDKRPACMT